MHSHKVKKLLTISIPTYNRAGLLDRCLNAIISQIPESKKDDIEIIVSNNASTDNTAAEVLKFQSRWPIVYFENSSNLGPDSNILQCFVKASGRYVWVFSDDEELLPGVLPRLLSFLESDNYGVVKLGAAGYLNEVDELAYYYNPASLDVTVYENPMPFFEELHYTSTFITGNIVNKEILNEEINFSEFLGTYLVQLGWVIRATFSGLKNVQITTVLLACKQGNSGGYKLLTIFSKNFNTVLKALVAQGMDKRIIDITNKNLITSYFPNQIRNLLYKESSFEKENGFQVLFGSMGKYPSFWKRVFPVYLNYWIRTYILRKKYHNL